MTRLTVIQGSQTCGLHWNLVAENEKKQRKFKGSMEDVEVMNKGVRRGLQAPRLSKLIYR